MQLGADGADFLVGMDHGFLRSARLAEDAARQQGRKRCRGAGARELAAVEVSAHFVGNLITPRCGCKRLQVTLRVNAYLRALRLVVGLAGIDLPRCRRTSSIIVPGAQQT